MSPVLEDDSLLLLLAATVVLVLLELVGAVALDRGVQRAGADCPLGCGCGWWCEVV